MSTKRGVFVSGTDTGVGKTLVSSLLVSALNQSGSQVGYFKPVQTGSDLDTVEVSRLSGVPSQEFSKPTYQFATPTAPSYAATLEGQQIQLDRIRKDWDALPERTWVVEGAGGLLVPLTAKQTIRDLISLLGLKLLLVSSTRLGTMNHTLLTVESAKAAGIPIVGIVLVGEEYLGLEGVLDEFTNVPILARIPQFEKVSPKLIQEKGSTYFSHVVLEQIYG